MVKKRGTREQVYNGEAMMTNGGLTKDDLEQRGNNYVSKKASKAVTERLKHLNNKPIKVKDQVEKLEKVIENVQVDNVSHQDTPKPKRKYTKKPK